MKYIGIILLGICFSAMAENQDRFQDWDVVDLDNLPMAMTINRAGNALMLICDPSINKCNWFVISKHKLCSKSQEMPVLIGIDNVAFPSEINCNSELEDDQYMHLLHTSLEISKALGKSKIFSVAIYQSSGEYSIMKFSLNGYGAAASLAAARAQELFKVRK